MFTMSFNEKKDLLGQVLNPGDVCARSINDKVELVVYRGDSWGGNKSKGEFGRFVTPKGPRSLKYTSVIFVFDPLSKRRAKTSEIVRITKQFYEERK